MMAVHGGISIDTDQKVSVIGYGPLMVMEPKAERVLCS